MSTSAHDIVEHIPDLPDEDDDSGIEDPVTKTLTENVVVTSSEHPVYAEDKCRGDDKFRCGKTNVFICEVQKCDGHSDCPNGEDEDPKDCLSGFCSSVFQNKKDVLFAQLTIIA